MFEVLKERGFVIPLFSIVVMLMLFVFSVVVLILVGLGMARIEQDVKAHVEEPTIVEISLNSLLEVENSYPPDNSKFINLLSLYNNTHDGTIENELQSIIDLLFNDENMALKISDKQLEPSSGITGVVTASASRKIAIPEGNHQKVFLRYIK